MNIILFIKKFKIIILSLYWDQFFLFNPVEHLESKDGVLNSTHKGIRYKSCHMNLIPIFWEKYEISKSREGIL